MLLICFDNLIVPFVHYRIAPYFDLVWLTSKETKPLFDRLGVNSVFLPYAANPNLSRCEEAIRGIGFVGIPYGSRANMINTLTENGIPVYCHCLKRDGENENEGFKPRSLMSQKQVGLEFLKFRQGGKVIEGAIVNRFKRTAILDENGLLHKVQTVLPSELYTVYPRYALALSSTAARNTGVLKHPLHIVNLRSFEIPMSGGLQICQYTREIATYFDEDKEIIFDRSNDELVEKAKYYCAAGQERVKMAMRVAARKKRRLNIHGFTDFQRYSIY